MTADPSDHWHEGAVLRGKRVLFLALLTAGVGQSFLFAVLPPLGREMGLSEVWIGTIVTVSALVFVVTSPAWGVVSERWGRRAVIILGLCFSSAMTALFAGVIEMRLAGMISVGLTFALMIIARSIFSATASGVFPAVQAYIADVTPPDRRTAGFTIIGAAFGLGMIGGPGLAWAMAEVSLVAPFFGIAALGGVAAVSAVIWLREPARHVTAPAADGASLDVVRALPYLAIGTLTMATLATVQQVTGFRVQDLYGLSAEETAAYAGAGLITLAGASIVAQVAMVRRSGFSPLVLIRTGSLVALLATAMLFQLEAFESLLIAMALLGIGLGLIFPGFMAAMSLVAGPDAQGRVAGLNASAQGLGFVAGPIAGASIYQQEPAAAYLFALALVAMVSVIAFTRRAPSLALD